MSFFENLLAELGQGAVGFAQGTRERQIEQRELARQKEQDALNRRFTEANIENLNSLASERLMPTAPKPPTFQQQQASEREAVLDAVRGAGGLRGDAENSLEILQGLEGPFTSTARFGVLGDLRSRIPKTPAPPRPDRAGDRAEMAALGAQYLRKANVEQGSVPSNAQIAQAEALAAQDGVANPSFVVNQGVAEVTRGNLSFYEQLLSGGGGPAASDPTEVAGGDPADIARALGLGGDPVPEAPPPPPPVLAAGDVTGSPSPAQPLLEEFERIQNLIRAGSPDTLALHNELTQIMLRLAQMGVTPPPRPLP